MKCTVHFIKHMFEFNIFDESNAHIHKIVVDDGFKSLASTVKKIFNSYKIEHMVYIKGPGSYTSTRLMYLTIQGVSLVFPLVKIVALYYNQLSFASKKLCLHSHSDMYFYFIDNKWHLDKLDKLDNPLIFYKIENDLMISHKLLKYEGDSAITSPTYIDKSNFGNSASS